MARTSVLLILFLAAAAQAQAVATPRYPSPSNATYVSIVATLAPAAAGAMLSQNCGNGGGFIVGGLLFGPAVGYWTGGVASKSVPGLLIRTGGLAIVGVGMIGCFANLEATTSCSNSANAVVIAGAAIVPLFSPSDRRVGVGVIVGF